MAQIKVSEYGYMVNTMGSLIAMVTWSQFLISNPAPHSGYKASKKKNQYTQLRLYGLLNAIMILQNNLLDKMDNRPTIRTPVSHQRISISQDDP